MTGRGSPMLNLRKSKVGKKKPSPKVCVEKSRASWNPGLEKALVDLLHEHNTPEHRGQNGWTHESWNLMAKKFHEKHQYANLTKSQIQEKEKELKRDYRILKDARKQSGASWNDQRCMIVAKPAVWANIIISFPRAKKFRNKPFPLFDALGELHDGNTADGIHNFTSIEPSQITTSTEADTIDVEASNTEVMFSDLQETSVYDDGQASMTRDREVEANMQRNATSTTTRNEGQEPKRRRQTADITGMMERFLDFGPNKLRKKLHG